jgi:hypothetical protein
MTVKYFAEDGTEFSDKYACIEYEMEQETKARNAYNTAVQTAMRDLDNQIWAKYRNPEDLVGNEAPLYLADEWLRNDISAILSDENVNDEEIGQEIFETIRATEYGEEILRRIRVDDIKKRVAVRRDFLSALKSVKDGSDLSSILNYRFSDDDLKHLAKLHKANKCRKKIEDLLTDCNFHSECSDFYRKNYAPYLA